MDAHLILQLEAGLIDSLPNESSADVNSDLAITPIDAAIILQVTGGLAPIATIHCPSDAILH